MKPVTSFTFDHCGRFALAALLIVTALLSGCSSNLSRIDKELPLAEPVQVDAQNQLMLARVNELLYLRELTEEQRAQLHYERGVLYDTMGLERLAMEDFRLSLQFKADYAEAYNFIGIYQLKAGNFEGAYESLDSVQELSPEHPYVQLNLGIALYYGQRPALAVEKLTAYQQQQPEDPYRILWLYLAESALDEEQAQTQLRSRYEALSVKPWSTGIIAVMLGDEKEKKFFSTLKEQSKSDDELARRLCEAYFYLAKWHQAQGNTEQAVRYFKLSLATNVQEFIEHRFSTLELERIREDEAKAAETAALAAELSD